MAEFGEDHALHKKAVHMKPWEQNLSFTQGVSVKTAHTV